MVNRSRNSTWESSISYLLFEDNSLFFCKASVEECGVILKLFKD